MAYQPVQNPWASAENPQTFSNDFWGEMKVDVWFCALVKGQGKIPYDPNTVDPKTGEAPRRYTAVDLTLFPLQETRLANPVKRHMLAEFGEWPDIVLPSLKDLGLTKLQDLSGKFARAEMVSTGRKYTNSNNEQKDATTFKFVAIFNTEQECVDAWKNRNGNGNGTTTQAQTPSWEAPANDNGNGNGEKEKETATKFLGAYVQNAVRTASKDPIKAQAELGVQIAAQPLLSKYFTADSPEVIEMVMAECAK